MSKSDAESKGEFRWKSCFLTSPVGEDLSKIRQTLGQLGISEIVTGYGSKYSSSSILNEVKKNIMKSDLVIAILREGLPNESVFFDLGLAHALSKEIVLLLPLTTRIPLFIESFPYYRLEEFDKRTISSVLNQFAKIRQLPAPEVRKKPLSKPLGDEVEGYRVELERIRIHGKKAPGEFETLLKLITTLLNASGISIISSSTKYKFGVRPDFGADLAVWSDDWNDSVGNPLLIEIKSQLCSDSFEPYNAYLKHVPQPIFVLVLYLHGPPTDRFRRATPFPVLFLKVDDLLERLKSEGFAEIVKDLRNKRVHGG